MFFCLLRKTRFKGNDPKKIAQILSVSFDSVSFELKNKISEKSANGLTSLIISHQNTQINILINGVDYSWA